MKRRTLLCLVAPLMIGVGIFVAVFQTRIRFEWMSMRIKTLCEAPQEHNISVLRQLVGLAASQSDPRRRGDLAKRIAVLTVEIPFGTPRDRSDGLAGVCVTYCELLMTTARELRDTLEPVVVLDMLVSGLKRIRREKENVVEWTRMWCSVSPNKSILDINDPRVKKLQEPLRGKVLLNLEKQRKMWLDAEVQNASRGIDHACENLTEFIAQKVVPYYLCYAPSTSHAEAVETRFREIFGRSWTGRMGRWD